MSNVDTVKNLIKELGAGGLEDNSIIELIIGLRQEYPQNDVVARLSETLELEQEDNRDESDYPWILFSINDTAYAINSKYVLSIELLGEITPIVDGPHYSPGMTRSRGEMIDLLDIRAVFGVGDYQSAKIDTPDAFYMIVVVEINGVKRGLIVDEIISVEHISEFEEGIMGDGGKVSSQHVSVIAKREKTGAPVLIINLDNLSML